LESLDGTSADGSSNQAITDALNADLNNDPTKLYISQSNSLSSTWYWYAELTDDLVTKYQSFPGVSPRTLSLGQSLTSVTGPQGCLTQQ
jgi:hypothetical protein